MAQVTNMRSRTPLRRPCWPLMTWTSKVMVENTSAMEPMNLAQAMTRSTCVSVVAWLLFGPSLALWPRSSSWWPSSSSTRRGESLMRSMTVCMVCCVFYIEPQTVFKLTSALFDKSCLLIDFEKTVGLFDAEKKGKETLFTFRFPVQLIFLLFYCLHIYCTLIPQTATITSKRIKRHHIELVSVP